MEETQENLQKDKLQGGPKTADVNIAGLLVASSSSRGMGRGRRRPKVTSSSIQHQECEILHNAEHSLLGQSYEEYSQLKEQLSGHLHEVVLHPSQVFF